MSATTHIMTNTVERRRRTGLYTYTDWSFAHNDSNLGYTQGPFVDTMTDVTGSPSLQHLCNHDTWSADVQGDTRSITAPEPPVGVLQYRCLSYKLDPKHSLKSFSNHLETATGLESLSRARIPALVRSDLTGFVALAEMGQQANSGAVALTRAIGSLAYAAYRGRPTKKQKRALRDMLLGQKNVSDIIQSLVGVNLEWQFGWKPFIRDIQAATAAFDKIHHLHAKLEKGTRVFGKADDSNSLETTDVIVEGGYNSLQVRCTCTTSTRKVVTSSIVRRIRNDKIGGDKKELLLPIIYDLFGLKPSLSRAWELVPLSFVVDWVYPVGQILETWEGMSVPQSDWIESFGGLESVNTITECTGVVSVRQGNYDMGFAVPGTAVRRTYTRYLVDFDTSIAAPYVPQGIRIPNTRYWFTGLQLLLQRMLK